jgi:uncharacterized membrane protein YgaE (UPF0421/DUF939 family)
MGEAEEERRIAAPPDGPGGGSAARDGLGGGSAARDGSGGGSAARDGSGGGSAALERLGGRSRDGVRSSWGRVRSAFVLAAQAGVGASLAWFFAHDVIGRPSPFFAPIAAVITLASSAGQRVRRTTELVIGVALGIGIGDAIILLIGRGPWQLGCMVLLAILVATAVGGGTPLVVQAASSAVLVATLAPGTGLPYTRFLDALVGGGVGLAVMTILLPLNPLAVVRRAADPALVALAAGLRGVADAVDAGDPGIAEAALTRLRGAEGSFSGFSGAIVAARENVAFAPARWRTRGALAQYVDGAEHLTYALRNVRVLIRRVITALGDAEPVPPTLTGSVRLLADAVDLLRHEWASGVEPVAARERALGAAAEAGRAHDDGVGFSGAVVVAQVRTTVADLLRATGVEHTEAVRLVRRAAGRHRRGRTGRGEPGRGAMGAGGNR